ncbi:hypothetical protein [Vibrio phage HY01]|nr:hypothetical protein [Vibrio phage HY01]
MRRYVSMDPKPWPSNNMNQEGPLHCAVALFFVSIFRRSQLSIADWSSKRYPDHYLYSLAH